MDRAQRVARPFCDLRSSEESSAGLRRAFRRKDQNLCLYLRCITQTTFRLARHEQEIAGNERKPAVTKLHREFTANNVEGFVLRRADPGEGFSRAVTVLDQLIAATGVREIRENA